MEAQHRGQHFGKGPPLYSIKKCLTLQKVIFPNKKGIKSTSPDVYCTLYTSVQCTLIPNLDVTQGARVRALVDDTDDIIITDDDDIEVINEDISVKIVKVYILSIYQFLNTSILLTMS